MNNLQFVKTSKGIDIRLGGGYLSANGTPIATYPIGTIVENVDPDFSPAKEYGGTWERFGQGKVLVGFDENDADFNWVTKEEDGATIFNTGGEKTHTLSESEMPHHSHAQRVLNTYGSNLYGYAHDMSRMYSTNYTNSINTAGAGGSQAHNNLQPYAVVYRWRRVA